MDEAKRGFPYWIIGVIIAVGALSATGYFYFKYQKTQKLLANPAEAAKEEIRQTLDKVKKLAVIPEGEEPTIVTINEVEKLRDNSFFKNAVNGDKMIVFSEAKKVVLYRPSGNRIVEINSLNQSESPQPSGNLPQATGIPIPTPTLATATVVILNGTTTTGLAGNAENYIKSQSKDFNIQSTGNAQNRATEKTLVVNLSENTKDQARALARLINAEMGSLPDGEVAPQSDILLILGKNYSEK